MRFFIGLEVLGLFLGRWWILDVSCFGVIRVIFMCVVY